MTEKFHLVFATDMGYLLPTQVAAASAIARASRPQDLVIHILDCGITEVGWTMFRNGLMSALPYGQSIVRHVIDMSRFDCFKEWRQSKGTYARLFLPQMLPDVQRCLYADGDVLFLDDVFKIWGFVNPGVAISGYCDRSDDAPIRAWIGKVGGTYDPGRYFCAGFITLNLDWFRRYAVTDRCMRYLHEHPDSPYPDQDALYLACYNAIQPLPAEWGCFNNDGFKNGLLPSVIHYNFGKPWQLGGTRYHCLTDMDMLWLQAAKRLLGFGLSDLGISRREYLFKYLLSFFRRLCGRIRRVFGLRDAWCERHVAAGEVMKKLRF